MLLERLVPIAPVGCSPMAEFAAHGLVGPFDASTQSVRSWMADALTIRHRLPRLWERVVAGDVHHWKARQIATLTAPECRMAAEVDPHTASCVEQLPWPTFLTSPDATMLQVGESAYPERERLAAAKREVRATPSEAGLRTLTDLLVRHADDPDPYREPWEKIAAHESDPSDPWADDLPAAS